MSPHSFYKVVLTSCLLLLICIIHIIANSERVTQMARSGVRVPYIYYDKLSKEASLAPREYYTMRIDWWVFDLGDVLTPVLLCLCFMIGADMSKLGFSMWGIWGVYFFLIMIDRILTLSKYPFAFWLELAFMLCQAYYVAYCDFIRRQGD